MTRVIAHMSKFLPSGHGRLALQLCAAAAVAALLAGCSTDSTRLSDPFSNPFASASNDPAPAPASHRGMGVGRQPPVVSQALPARSSSVASVAPLRPGLTRSASAAPIGRDVTGSIEPTPARSARGAAYGGWTSSGGVPVTVGQGDTAEVLSKRYGVPATALLQTNGLASPSDLRPGATITIPIYNAVAAAPQAAPARMAQAEPAPARLEPAAPRVSPKLAKAALLKPRAERMAEAEQRNAARPQKTAERPVVAADAHAHVHPGSKGDKVEAIAAGQRTKKAEAKAAQAVDEKPSLRKGEKGRVAADTAPAGKHVAEKVEAAPPAPVKAAALKPAPAAKPAPVKTAALAPAPAPEAPAAPKAEAPASASAAAPAAPVADASGNPEFRWPARGRIIQGFKGGNDGINIAVPEGTAVKAAETGTVAYAGSELKGYGNLVLIRHPNGYVTAYANNGELDVKRGDQVKRGQTIAKSGQSGNVSSPQLHFELRKGSTPVDPTSYLAGL